MRRRSGELEAVVGFAAVDDAGIDVAVAGAFGSALLPLMWRVPIRPRRYY